MEQVSLTFAQNIWKKLIRFAVNTLVLLILRAILGSLPMLKNASAFGDSLMSPLVLAYAVVDSVILVVIIDFGIALAHDLQARYEHIPDLGKLVSLTTVLVALICAYKVYELPTACVVVQPADLLSLGQSGTPAGFGEFMRAWTQMAGQVSAAAMQNATGDALISYQRLALAVLRRPPNIYAWTFVILVAFPAAGIVALVSRNLDTFTDLLSHTATAFRGTGGLVGTVAGSSARGGAESSGAGQGMSARDMVEKLGKLKSLLDSEVISKEDFETQKMKLLGRAAPNSKPSEPEDFRKLKSLLDSGALTEEEYKTHKERLLEQI